MEIFGYAKTKEEAGRLLERAGLLRLDSKSGVFEPLVEVQITPSGANDLWDVLGVEGFHFNLRFWGQAAAQLQREAPAGGFGREADLADKTRLLEVVESKAKAEPKWEARAEDKVPPGYEIEGCRFYGVEMVAERRNSWA